MEFPFKESKIEGNLYLREFEESVDIDDLEWHRDREDRIVEIIGTTDWQLQMDNELPKIMSGKFFIPKEVWHRIIKGNGDLKVRITKL
jgi:hypothetical protein